MVKIYKNSNTMNIMWKYLVKQVPTAKKAYQILKSQKRFWYKVEFHKLYFLSNKTGFDRKNLPKLKKNKNIRNRSKNLTLTKWRDSIRHKNRPKRPIKDCSDSLPSTTKTSKPAKATFSQMVGGIKASILPAFSKANLAMEQLKSNGS